MKSERPPLLCWLRLHRWERQESSIATWDECQRCYSTRDLAAKEAEPCQHVWVTTWGTSATREHCSECHDVRAAKEAEREA